MRRELEQSLSVLWHQILERPAVQRWRVRSYLIIIVYALYYGHAVFLPSLYCVPFVCLYLSGVVTRLAGSVGGNIDGIGTSAAFSSPSGVAVTRQGVVFVADRGNNIIRMISPTGQV